LENFAQSGASAGGENGFSQAIVLASDTLSNVKFVQEKRLISKFFDEISQDTGKYGFGVNETLQLMEMGAVETLVVWENLEVDRCILKNTATGEEVIKFLNKEQQRKSETYRCGYSCLFSFGRKNKVQKPCPAILVMLVSVGKLTFCCSMLLLVAVFAQGMVAVSIVLVKWHGCADGIFTCDQRRIASSHPCFSTFVCYSFKLSVRALSAVTEQLCRLLELQAW
jgi:hypothetical protein